MEIRDNRQKEWFWLDNEYLNGYAKHLGASCTVVYLSLCRHANNETQQCYPSMRLIAEENGISTKTVERATKKLEEWGIIHIKKEKGNDGRQLSNVYTLMSKTQWKSKPTDTKSVGTDRQKGSKPTDKLSKNRQTPVRQNNTNNNNTYINKTAKETFAEDIPEIIKAFEDVNPAFEKWYGNKTQRTACERLLKKHGKELVLGAVRILPKSNLQRYLPTITTPLQLEDKWAQLEVGLRKIKNNKPVIL